MKYPCTQCGFEIELRGARVFTPAPCPACGAAIRARTDFAGYRLGDPIARSGLAVLFHATDPVTGVEFALKLIQPPRGTEPEDLGRFIAETRAVAALDHPHCARTFGAGVEEGFAWVATELLTGGSLAGRLAAVGRLSEAETLTCGLQVASALAAAQAAGLTHHDIEPNNLVFDEVATLKVTDFGQAVFYERLSDEVGIIWGRPALVAPERLGRAREDELTDIYGLGATLFCALTGAPPYGGEAHGQILFDRMGSEPIRIENSVRALHPSTVAVLNRMLSASRGRRFQTWEEVIDQLTRAHSELTGRAAPRTPTPHPAPAPAPRIAPASAPIAPALPTKAPAAEKARRSGLLALAVFAIILCVLGFLGWKQWFVPKLRLPVRAQAPIVPTSAAIVSTPPANELTRGNR